MIVVKKIKERAGETGIITADLEAETGIITADLEAETGIITADLETETGIITADLETAGATFETIERAKRNRRKRLVREEVRQFRQTGGAPTGRPTGAFSSRSEQFLGRAERVADTFSGETGQMESLSGTDIDGYDYFITDRGIKVYFNDDADMFIRDDDGEFHNIPFELETGADRAYTVSAGDTLSIIARREYQDASLWRKLYDYNRARGKLGANPDIIRLGESMILPDKATLTGAAAAVTPGAAETPGAGPPATPSGGSIIPAFLDFQLTQGAQDGSFLGLSKTLWFLGAGAIAALTGAYLLLKKKGKKR